MKTDDDRAVCTVAERVGAPLSDAFRDAWVCLHACTNAELNYLRIDGLRAIQLTRLDEEDVST